jgi:hypothetical protein
MEDRANTPRSDCGLCPEWGDYFYDDPTHDETDFGFTPQFIWDKSKELLPALSPKTIEPLWCTVYDKHNHEEEPPLRDKSLPTLPELPDSPIVGGQGGDGVGGATSILYPPTIEEDNPQPRDSSTSPKLLVKASENTANNSVHYVKDVVKSSTVFSVQVNSAARPLNSAAGPTTEHSQVKEKDNDPPIRQALCEYIPSVSKLLDHTSDRNQGFLATFGCEYVPPKLTFPQFDTAPT